MKVIADTNVLVSARIVPVGTSAAIFRQIALFEHVTSPEILAETEQVLHRKHIRQRYHLGAEDITQYIALLRDVSTVIEPTEHVTVVHADPDDDKVLSLAKEVQADYIVSGDPHLTDLGEWAGIAIVTPAQFVVILPTLSRGMP